MIVPPYYLLEPDVEVVVLVVLAAFTAAGVYTLLYQFW
jgi:hypothetical protein